MSHKISFRVYGKPLAQGRPRAFKTKAGHIGMYDPKTSADWKDSVRKQALFEMGRRIGLLQGALAMKLIFRLPRPKSLPKKVRYPVKKPDLDNLVKSIKDALEGVCYLNDSVIIQEQNLKVYCQDGERPGVDIEIWEVDK